MVLQTLASHDMNVPDFIRVVLSEYEAEYVAVQFKLHMTSNHVERHRITARLEQIAAHLCSMRSWLETCENAAKEAKDDKADA